MNFSSNNIGYIRNVSNLKSLLGDSKVLESFTFAIDETNNFFGILQNKFSQVYRKDDLSSFKLDAKLVGESGNNLISYDNLSKRLSVYDLDGNILNSYSTESVYLSSALIGNDAIVFSRDRKIVKENFLTGEMKWSFDIPYVASSFRSVKDLFFYTNRSDTIFCNNINDGSSVWSLNLASLATEVGTDNTLKFGDRIYLHNGMIIFLAHDSTIVALEQISGELKWTYKLDHTRATLSFSGDDKIIAMDLHLDPLLWLKFSLAQLKPINNKKSRTKKFVTSIPLKNLIQERKGSLTLSNQPTITSLQNNPSQIIWHPRFIIFAVVELIDALAPPL